PERLPILYAQPLGFGKSIAKPLQPMTGGRTDATMGLPTRSSMEMCPESRDSLDDDCLLYANGIGATTGARERMDQIELIIREPNKTHQWRLGSLTKLGAGYSNINCTARDPQPNLGNSGGDTAALATLVRQTRFLAPRASTQERSTINLDAPTFARSIPDTSDA